MMMRMLRFLECPSDLVLASENRLDLRVGLAFGLRHLDEHEYRSNDHESGEEVECWT